MNIKLAAGGLLWQQISFFLFSGHIQWLLYLLENNQDYSDLIVVLMGLYNFLV